MSLITLFQSVANIIRPVHFNDLFSALRMQFVGRGTAGGVESGQDLGTSTYPWGNGYIQNLKVTDTFTKGDYPGNRPLGAIAPRKWTQVSNTQFGAQTIRSACFAEEKKIWVIGGTDGTISYSYDGITWTAGTVLQPAGDLNYDILKIVYCKKLSRFVLVGDGDDTSSTYAYYSDDGITWTLVTSSGFYGGTDVCCSEKDGLYLSVGGPGLTKTEASISSDGVNWTRVFVGSTSFPMQVCYYDETNGIYLVGGLGIPNAQLAQSTDAETWSTQQISELGASNINGLAYSKEIDRYIAASGTSFVYSDDLLSFTACTGTTGLYPSAENSLSVFMSVSAYANYSLNGERWDRSVDMGFGGSTVFGIAYSEYFGQFLTFGANGKAAYSL